MEQDDEVRAFRESLMAQSEAGGTSSVPIEEQVAEFKRRRAARGAMLSDWMRGQDEGDRVNSSIVGREIFSYLGPEQSAELKTKQFRGHTAAPSAVSKVFARLGDYYGGVDQEITSKLDEMSKLNLMVALGPNQGIPEIALVDQQIRVISQRLEEAHLERRSREEVAQRLAVSIPQKVFDRMLERAELASTEVKKAVCRKLKYTYFGFYQSSTYCSKSSHDLAQCSALGIQLSGPDFLTVNQALYAADEVLLKAKAVEAKDVETCILMFIGLARVLASQVSSERAKVVRRMLYDSLCSSLYFPWGSVQAALRTVLSNLEEMPVSNATVFMQRLIDRKRNGEYQQIHALP